MDVKTLRKAMKKARAAYKENKEDKQLKKGARLPA
jgi:hypothetical protein